MDDDMFRAIQSNIAVAEYDFREETGRDAQFDLATVEWIERRARAFALGTGPSGTSRAELYSVLGSAFAECLRRLSGGDWAFVNGEWFGIHVASHDLTLDPWNKIRGALDGEDGESPVGMYRWLRTKLNGESGAGE